MTSDRLYTTLERWFSRATPNSGVRRVADLHVAVTSDIGLVREENQDRVGAMQFQDWDGTTLMLVALGDGMGGMRDGAACASMTLAMFFADFATSHGRDYEARLLRAVQAANNSVHKRYRGTGGATLSAVLVTELGRVFAVNVGDSRIYQFGWRLLRQITIDDTIAGQLSRRGESFHGGNELLQFVGIGPEIEPHIFETEEAFGESGLLLTSDGVHFLPKESMEAVMTHAPEPAMGMKRLVDLAKWSGGPDNASAALVTAPPARMSGERTANSVSVDVWDPFGEVQCLILGAEHPEDRQSQKPDLAPTPNAAKKTRPPRKRVAKSAEQPLRAGKDKIQNEAMPPPTDEARDEGKVEETGEGKEVNKPDAPQLIIDFPNKTPDQ